MSEFEFKVVNSRDQIEPQSKAFTPIAVPLTHNAKDFQTANSLFNQNAPA